VQGALARHRFRLCHDMHLFVVWMLTFVFDVVYLPSIGLVPCNDDLVTQSG
jgi:hypothetical protein